MLVFECICLCAGEEAVELYLCAYIYIERAICFSVYACVHNDSFECCACAGIKKRDNPAPSWRGKSARPKDARSETMISETLSENQPASPKNETMTCVT